MTTLVSERSALNPNAPLFIPNVYRQVEDFSPEWWELVKTSSWYGDFWLSQHPEGFYDGSAGADDDLMNLLPEDLDAGIEEEFPNLEAQFEEMVMLAEAEEKTYFRATDPNWKARFEQLIKLESQFEEMFMLAVAEEKTYFRATDPKAEMKPLNGLLVDVNALLNDLIVPKSLKDRNPRSPRTPTKYQMKPLHCVAGKQRAASKIQQPR